VAGAGTGGRAVCALFWWRAQPPRGQQLYARASMTGAGAAATTGTAATVLYISHLPPWEGAVECLRWRASTGRQGGAACWRAAYKSTASLPPLMFLCHSRITQRRAPLSCGRASTTRDGPRWARHPRGTANLRHRHRVARHLCAQSARTPRPRGDVRHLACCAPDLCLLPPPSPGRGAAMLPSRPRSHNICIASTAPLTAQRQWAGSRDGTGCWRARYIL